MQDKYSFFVNFFSSEHKPGDILFIKENKPPKINAELLEGSLSVSDLREQI